MASRLLIPNAPARQAIAAAAWIWPVLIWSQMGAREARNRTESLVFCSQGALYRQLPAVWTAGALVAFVTGGGFGLRLFWDGDWRALAAWLVGALFIPSLALGLGVLSGSSKLFEVLYTMWWYAGLVNHTPGLDFMSTVAGSSSAEFYLVLTGALLITAYFGRRAKLGYV